MCVLLLYLGNVGLFLRYIPPFESLDEVNHVMMAHFIASEGRVPTMDDAPSTPPWMAARVQYNQPALPYLSGALILRSIGMASPFDLENPSWRLPTAEPQPICIGEPYRVYLRSATNSVYTAVLFLRMINVALGLLSVSLVICATQRLFQSDVVALLAGASFACAPSTVELHAWYNNDAWVVLCGALGLWGISLLHPFPRLGAVVLGSASVLALLTKLTATPLVLVATGIFWSHWGRKRMQHIILFVIMVLVSLVAWLALNYTRCEELICRLHHGFPFATWPTFVASLFEPAYLRSVVHFVRTLATPWILPSYEPTIGTVAFGFIPTLLGLMVAAGTMRRYKAAWPLWALLGTALALTGFRVYWSPDIVYMPFRYIAVAIPTLSVCVALGWGTLAGHFGRLLLVVPLLMYGLTTLMVVFIYYQPPYQALPILHELPTDSKLMESSTFTNGVQVVAYRINQTSLQIYWRATEPQSKPLYAVVSLYDEQRRLTEQCGITVGTALHPVTIWQIDAYVQQHFWFQSPNEAHEFSVQLFDILPRYYLLSETAFQYPYSLQQSTDGIRSYILFWELDHHQP